MPSSSAINEGAEFYALVYLEKEPFPEIEIQLFADKAPLTVNNFIKLVNESFYDGLAFHRVVPGELVQTGDPTGTGNGGPGYVIEDEFHPDLRHDAAGIVAMANSGNPPGGSNGSQFYITLAPLPDRDGLKPDDSPKDCANEDLSCHSVFGRVTKGMHLIDADSEPRHHSAIQQGDVIRKIEIIKQYPADSPNATRPADCANGTVVPNPQLSPNLVEQCETLLKIKRTLAGDAKLNWSDEIPMKFWHGIQLNRTGNRLELLELYRRGLTGKIPSEIGELIDLRVFDLSFNQLSGEIPHEIKNLTNLRELHLYNNKLSGEIPPGLWNLKALEVLSLGENDLIGELPSEIGNLRRLKFLYLQVAQLSGPIPVELMQLRGLESLILGYNQFTGPIPPEISNLTNLVELLLHHNQLTGSIPREIGSLTKLKVLDLGNNPLQGSIPSEIGDLTELEDLGLYQTQLSGDLPVELTQLHNLQILILSENQLTGTIPPEFGNLSNAWWFDLRGNYFDGCIPETLRGIDHGVHTLLYCDDPPIAWPPESVFAGGIDLAVTYIERLPRYPKYKVSFFDERLQCPYPHDQPMGPVVCPDNEGVKRNPEPGDLVRLTAHVRNFGDTDTGKFDYIWRSDEKVLETGEHESLPSGGSAGITIDYIWPDRDSNPVVTFEVDPENQIDEIFEVNNAVQDWIKGHTLGIYFSEETYESLRLSAEVEGEFQSPEHWFRNNLDRLNELLIEAGVEDRVRAELFYVASERTLDAKHELKWLLDGWWGIWHDTHAYSLDGYYARMEIDGGLLHEMLHQLGVIDIYRMTLGVNTVLLQDANRPGKFAGCGVDYWNSPSDCYLFSTYIHDIMVDPNLLYIGIHTAAALRVNAGHRRGYYGEYLFDVPANVNLEIVDKSGNPLSNVDLRFYQLAERQVGEDWLPFVDDIAEFTVTTNNQGIAELPNRGHTGILTATGHQLRPNPFGVIDVVGGNGIFLIEMTSDQCTNYEWLTIVELNLAYWDGQTERAEFTKTLRCPPP